MEIKGKFDHFNINVSDLGRSLDFYAKALGLHELKRKQAPDGSFTLVYLGATRRAPTNWATTKATCASAWRATTMPHAPSTATWAASATKITTWGSTSSPIRTTTGSKCCPKNEPPMESIQQEVEEAVRTLRAGGLILYPTDTVWGIGCDAANAEAVARIYALKGSENKKAMLVLCASADMVVRYANRAPGIAFEVMELADKPLTLILPGASGLAKNLIPEEGTLGVRIPDHEFCRRLLRAFGRPVVSTSANRSGEPAAATLADTARGIVEGVDFVVDPRFEGHPTRKPSSIVAFTEDGAVRIIRE